MNCPSCHTPQGALKFCTRCGTALPQPTPAQPVPGAAPGTFCAACGARTTGSPFCTRCGAAAVATTQLGTSSSVSVEEQISPPAAPDPQMSAQSTATPLSTEPAGSSPYGYAPANQHQTARVAFPGSEPYVARATYDAPTDHPGAVPRRRRRGRVVMGTVVAVLVLVVGGAAVTLAVTHRDANAETSAPPAQPSTGTSDPAETADQPSQTTTTTSAAAPSSSSTTSAPPAVTASQVAAARLYRCWTGKSARSLAKCGSPYAAAQSAAPLAGLNWVFTDRGTRLEEVGAVCHDISLADRSLHRQCTFSLAEDYVCMDWSQFNAPALGREDYDRLGAPTATSGGGGMTVLYWSPIYHGHGGCQGLPYKGAKMIQDQSWGVAAYSTNATAAAHALARFGQFRPIDQWPGVPR